MVSQKYTKYTESNTQIGSSIPGIVGLGFYPITLRKVEDVHKVLKQFAAITSGRASIARSWYLYLQG